MTIRTYIFKYFLLLGVVIFGANGVYSATSIENPILNVTYTLAMVAATVATGIYINNTFKVVK